MYVISGANKPTCNKIGSTYMLASFTSSSLLFWSQKISSPVVQAGLQFSVLNWNSWSSCLHLPIVGMTGVCHYALPVCFIFSILQWNWKRILSERRAQPLHARVVVLIVRSQHFSLAAECLMALLDLNTRKRIGSSR